MYDLSIGLGNAYIACTCLSPGFSHQRLCVSLCSTLYPPRSSFAYLALPYKAVVISVISIVKCLPAFFISSRFRWLSNIPRFPSNVRDHGLLRSAWLACTTWGKWLVRVRDSSFSIWIFLLTYMLQRKRSSNISLFHGREQHSLPIKPSDPFYYQWAEAQICASI
jgi:hypothetical protein